MNAHPDQRYGCHSYAQHGDDFMLLNLFDLMGVKNPSYLDIGAHDPSIISNTRLLYERGSRGVNVDANLNLHTKFQIERPHDVNVFGVAVGPEHGTGEFYMYSDTSGRNTISLDEVKSLNGVLTVKSKKPVPIKTINELVETYCNGKFPDLLNIDIEGMDYAVLNSADFEQFGYPKVICIETRPVNTRHMMLLAGFKGYFLYCRMGENLFFVHTEYASKAYGLPEDGTG